ncbi:spore protease YyaC [Bacillus sp. HMF5848]|uniref:spore protease YyaC n=1 Tax=Bacillus sp. HMF5848 TaxID=2495421 RepID=UPI000F7A0554|nr:spore protease YyaC [Bacillus sp. HMF5848]RSK29185.1 spore protease YyaC [Bacillus sp. HMF5848]
MNLKANFFEKKGGNTRISHDEAGAFHQISTKLQQLLPTSVTRPVAIVCIGTDRSTGDSLGPLIGTKLLERKTPLFHIYGTLAEPIHAVNMEEQLLQIKTKHYNPFIIGIDACLGRLNSVGVISIGEGPVKPGAGVNKELPAVGDAHITGIVNVSGFMEFFVLQNTRLHLVMKMADTISQGIYHAAIAKGRRQSLDISHQALK